MIVGVEPKFNQSNKLEVRILSTKKKPVNGLLIIAIIAASILYGSYLSENQYMTKQLEVFGRIGQQPQSGEDQETSSSDRFGYIKPQVVDGFSEEPIEGAIVVIPEINKNYKTDEKGHTPDIKIDVSPDPHYKSINPKNWGEITLIIYKEGYIEYVLLHLNVWEDQNRQGPKILLFPRDSKELDQPMSIVEGPNQIWINSLVEKYRP